jgi:hypothetical protein
MVARWLAQLRRFWSTYVDVTYIAATPEKVWQALTDPVQLSEWAPLTPMEAWVWLEPR